MNGIDVSALTGAVDWISVKDNLAFKVSFAYIACTEGVGYNDSQRALNSKNAKIAGLKIGYIHSSLMANEPEEESEYFMKSMSVLPKADLPPVLHIECNKPNLDSTYAEFWIGKFIKLVQKSYPNVILKSNVTFLHNSLPLEHGLGHIPLWVSQYTASVTPDLPAGWDSWFMWNFASKGKVSGITGNVNLNRMKTSL